jgi:hypothetical protein
MKFKKLLVQWPELKTIFVEVLVVDELDNEDVDPSVPTELLDLHVQLEEAGITPEEFKEVYDESSDTS